VTQARKRETKAEAKGLQRSPREERNCAEVKPKRPMSQQESNPSDDQSGNANLLALSRLFGLYRSRGKAKETPLLLDDVDHVVESSTGSPEEAVVVLRGIVADLLKEMESISAQLEESKQAQQTAEEEATLIRETYVSQLEELSQSMNTLMGEKDLPSETPFATANAAQASRTGSSNVVIPPQQATEMVIRGLSTKIEELHSKNGKLEEQLMKTTERMEDLESENEARAHTIDALEAHFRSLNVKSRTAPPPSASKLQSSKAASHPHDSFYFHVDKWPSMAVTNTKSATPLTLAASSGSDHSYSSAYSSDEERDGRMGEI